MIIKLVCPMVILYHDYKSSIICIIQDMKFDFKTDKNHSLKIIPLS